LGCGLNFSMALLVDYVANARSMAEYDNLGWALDIRHWSDLVTNLDDHKCCACTIC
jgi:hypothetical protein